MILPIWRAFLPLAVFAATGAALDRVLALGLAGGVGKWARWAACGIVAAFAAALHPLVLGSLVTLAVIARVTRGATGRRYQSPPASTPSPSGSRQGPPWWGIAAATLTLVVVCRPATLAYWDSFVWMAKSRIESDGGWGALRAATLDRSADVMPSGYPMLWSLAASWLSMGGRSMETLGAGAAAMTLVTLMLFLDAAAEAAAVDPDPTGLRPRWAPAALGLVAVTPLVLVHLRSAYADLPVGLLAATCTLRLARGLERPGDAARDLSIAAIAAAALVGMKDEGMAHVAALVGAVVVVRISMGARVPLGPVMAVLTAAAIPFNGWRMLLLAHHVADVDHKPSAPDFEAAGAIGRTLLHHLSDTRSWGALWPIAFACAALVLARGKTFRAMTRVAAVTFLAEGALLAGALVFGPARVRVFAFEGTLVNRLLLQIAPAAGAMLMLALADAAMAWQTVRRPSLRPIALSTSPAPQVPRSRAQRLAASRFRTVGRQALCALGARDGLGVDDAVVPLEAPDGAVGDGPRHDASRRQHGRTQRPAVRDEEHRRALAGEPFGSTTDGAR